MRTSGGNKPKKGIKANLGSLLLKQTIQFAGLQVFPISIPFGSVTFCSYPGVSKENPASVCCSLESMAGMTTQSDKTKKEPGSLALGAQQAYPHPILV